MSNNPTAPRGPTSAGATDPGGTSGLIPPTAPTTDVWDTVRREYEEALARISDPATDYNVAIAELTAKLQALTPGDPATDFEGKTSIALSQQLQAQLKRRSDDAANARNLGNLYQDELESRRKAAQADKGLTPKEEAALDAQLELYKRQQAQVEQQIAADKAANDLALDPTNVQLKQDAAEAQIRASDAQAAAGTAQAKLDEIAATFKPGELQAANDKARYANEAAARTLAAGGPEAEVDVTKATARQIAEQTAASTTERLVNEEKLKHEQLGALGTFIDQMHAAVGWGLISQADAEKQIAAQAQALETGASPFEWQSQADLNARAISQQILQSGAATAPGQQYMTGDEPGGAIAQALAGYGYADAGGPRLAPVSQPAYMQSVGLTGGAPRAAAGAPAQAQGAGQGPLDYSHLSKAQVDAIFAHAQQLSGVPAPAPAPAPAAQLAGAPGGTTVVVNTTPPTPLPPGHVMGGVGGGLPLTEPPAGAPNYVRTAP